MKQRFIVEVTHRQNATWQGSVTWVEEDRTLHFRSALELIRLIDSTIGESDQDKAAERPGPFPCGLHPHDGT